MQNGVQSTFSDEKCSLPGCNQRKRVESGIIHDFCRKSHAIKAREQGTISRYFPRDFSLCTKVCTEGSGPLLKC